MSILITVLIYLAVLAVIWWVVSTLPLPPPFDIVARVIFAILAIVMLLSLVGGVGPLGGCGTGLHVGRL